MLKDIFGFSEHPKETIYGLGYYNVLLRNKDENVIDKVAGNADARIEIDHIHWYVSHYTLSIQQQCILSN